MSKSVIKLLRTIRLDASDSFVFDPPAAAGEWAVPGGFMFLDVDPTALQGRQKQAFRAGFLGLTSFGWSTLAVVVEATAAERAAALDALATYLQNAHGAPCLATARAAAEDEMAYAASLADHPVQTLIALHRSVTAEGHVSEQFRTLSKATARDDAKMPCSAGAFAIVDAGDEIAAAGDEIDLAALSAAASRSNM
jgi:Family of unknown function (DUF6505)